MHDPDTIKRTLLPLGFFGALMLILLLGESLGPTTATTFVIHGDTPEVRQVPEPDQVLPTCTENSDCPLPTTYCDNGYCTHLKSPVCDCSQPQVMRCQESGGRARFMYCETACVETGDGAICQ